LARLFRTRSKTFGLAIHRYCAFDVSIISHVDIAISRQKSDYYYQQVAALADRKTVFSFGD
jgi:hypothetical protein